MMKPAAAERLTGYKIGGISPFAQARAVPTAVDESALAEPFVVINAGQRGLLLQVDPRDARRVLQARTAALGA